MSVKICKDFSGEDVAARRFLFSGDWPIRELDHSDMVILAVDSNSIVGGLVVRRGVVVYSRAIDGRIMAQLTAAAKGGS